VPLLHTRSVVLCRSKNLHTRKRKLGLVTPRFGLRSTFGPRNSKAETLFYWLTDFGVTQLQAAGFSGLGFTLSPLHLRSASTFRVVETDPGYVIGASSFNTYTTPAHPPTLCRQVSLPQQRQTACVHGVSPRLSPPAILCSLCYGSLFASNADTPSPCLSTRRSSHWHSS
jgi:hypothetical protein